MRCVGGRCVRGPEPHEGFCTDGNRGYWGGDVHEEADEQIVRLEAELAAAKAKAKSETARCDRLIAELKCVSGALCDAGDITIEPYHEGVRLLTTSRNTERARADRAERERDEAKALMMQWHREDMALADRDVTIAKPRAAILFVKAHDTLALMSHALLDAALAASVKK